MSEIHNELVSQECWLLDTLKILYNSFKILLKNLKIFFFIFTLTIFPLSLLLFTFSLYSHPLKAQIHQLEALALVSATRFEARHVWKQSRADSLTLLRVKALFFFPTCILSILATITTVNSASLAHSGKHPSWETAVTAVREAWKRLVVTTMYVYVYMLAYVMVAYTLTVVVGTAKVRWLVEVLKVVLEVYVMAVLSIGMVVSVNEERFGWEAVKVGWKLMKGKRFCGWVLAGFSVLMSSGIGLRFGVLMDGHDLMVGIGSMLLSCSLFGFVIIWSCVVNTVLYCECRKRHSVIIRLENNQNSPVTVVVV